MAHIPYGYRIVNGKAEYHPIDAEKVKQFIEYYLQGDSIKKAKEKADLPICNSTAGRILSLPVYLGDDYYPPLYDQKTAEMLAEERQKRYEAQGSFQADRTIPPIPVKSRFLIRHDRHEHLDRHIIRPEPENQCESQPNRSESEKKRTEERIEDNPNARAAAIYSMIISSESGTEVISDQDQKWLQNTIQKQRKKQNHKSYRNNETS